MHYFVKAGKWFDKINGNTYFNAHVYDAKGQFILETGFQYGYGSQYLHEAHEQLKRVVHGNTKIIIHDMGCAYTTKSCVQKGWF